MHKSLHVNGQELVPFILSQTLKCLAPYLNHLGAKSEADIYTTAEYTAALSDLVVIQEVNVDS